MDAKDVHIAQLNMAWPKPTEHFHEEVSVFLYEHRTILQQQYRPTVCKQVVH